MYVNVLEFRDFDTQLLLIIIIGCRYDLAVGQLIEFDNCKLIGLFSARIWLVIKTL